ncbi:MAG: ferrous iron transport protein A [Phycisphaerales bacterium]|nr:ferrous iron transport protein A [Phycisphaerales bacterium]
MPRLLANLSPGENGRITHVAGEADVRHQLLEMGLTSGTLVRMVRVAPLGDPLELHVRGYRLSVRKSEAAMVTIEGD